MLQFCFSYAGDFLNKNSSKSANVQINDVQNCKRCSQEHFIGLSIVEYCAMPVLTQLLVAR